MTKTQTGRQMCKLVRVKTNQNRYVNVASHKKDCIATIIRAAQKCRHIDQIILFGSALEERCTEHSDIDIAIISDIPRSKLFRDKEYDAFTRTIYLHDRNQSYDILQFNTQGAIEKSSAYVCKEILTKGKMIYQKGGQVAIWRPA